MTGAAASPRPAPGGSDRAAAVVFGAVVAVAGPLIAWLNRDQWFHGDEFAFLFKRDLADPVSLFDPHWGHLTALPALAYQALYRLVGLHHYWPYQWLVIVAHLTVAVLLRALMRRAEVHPWLATAAATTFVFLGSGRENLAWGFQVTLTGSIAFGLGALLVLTAEDRRRRLGGLEGRDLLAALLLVGGVLCSNVGVTMAVVAGLATVALGPDLRSALRRAGIVVGPAAAVYLLWSALAPPSEYGVDPSGPATAIDFAVDVLVAAVRGLARSDLVALAAVVALAAGLALVARRWGPGSPQVYAVPGALLVGAVLSAALVGYARAADAFVRPGTARYVYLVVALVLVPLAVAVHELVRGRGPVVLALACVAVLLGLPGNVALVDPSSALDRDRLGSAAETAHLAALAATSGLPAEEVITGELTVAGLTRAREEGRLPDPPEDPDAEGRATLLLALAPGGDPGGACRDVDDDRPVTLQVGQSLAFEGSIVVRHAVGDARHGRLKVTTARPGGSALRVRWGSVEVVASSPGGPPVRVCG